MQNYRLPADGLELELQRGDDAEVAAATAQPPEELGVAVGAGAHPRGFPRARLFPPVPHGVGVGETKLRPTRPCESGFGLRGAHGRAPLRARKGL